MNIKANSVVNRVIGGIVTIFIAVFLNWIFLPAWNIQSEDFWWYWIVVGIFAIEIFWIVEKKDAFISRILVIIWSIILVIALLGSLSSSRLFNAVSYSNLIKIEEGNFKDEIPSISTSEEANNFPLLDVQTAQELGNRSLSEIDKVSQFEVNGEYNLISYDEKQYRLSPLE